MHPVAMRALRAILLTASFACLLGPVSSPAQAPDTAPAPVTDAAGQPPPPPPTSEPGQTPAPSAVAPPA
ncbi:MAG TPA: hypothetical protein VGD64_03970, partial [Acidisarcina sp.]